MPKRTERIVKVVILIYVLYIIYSSLWVGGFKSKTEHQTKLLASAVENEQHTNWLQYGLKYHPNVMPKLPDEATVRQQLAFQFPYEPNKAFEKNIWQTWKVGLDDDSFPSHYKEFLESWKFRNDKYNHYVLSDFECQVLIDQLYASVPDVKRAYSIMPKSILKADFFRYLILFAKGGVYSDIDTVCLKPIDKWASSSGLDAESGMSPGLVVGIESDPDRPDWADWYTRRIQFCQWSMQAKRGHPMLRELVARITNLTLTREKKGELKKILGKDAGGDIMNWTGPAIWTDVVFEYMNNVMQPQNNFKLKKYDELISWKTFTGMTSPQFVKDVLVLPITSFSPGVGHMGSKDRNDPMAYVEHKFLSSWKSDDKTPGSA